MLEASPATLLRNYPGASAWLRSTLACLLALAASACGDSGGGGPLDLGDPAAGTDDAVAAEACERLGGSPTEVAAAANGADAPTLSLDTAYLVEPVPSGAAFVRFTIPSGSFRGGYFVSPSESVLQATQNAQAADLSAPSPNGHCPAENLSDYRLVSEVGGDLILELDGDAPLWMVLVEGGGAAADGGDTP